MRIALLLLLDTSALAFSRSASGWIKKGDAFKVAGKSNEALEAYRNAEKSKPNDASLLVKIAKQYGDLMPSLLSAAKKEASAKSLVYSRKVVAMNPMSSDFHLALELSLGKNTEFMGNRQKIEASREITPLFLDSAPATGSFNGLHAKSKFLATAINWKAVLHFLGSGCEKFELTD